MIQGEMGAAVLDHLVALQMDALVDGDAITCALMAACFADALRKEETPRRVAQGLLDSLPSDLEWESGVREKVREALELREERAA